MGIIIWKRKGLNRMARINAEALENLWYHEKGKIIGGIVFLVIVLIVVLNNVVFGSKEPKPDVQMAYMTDGRQLSDEAVASIKEYLAPAIQDLNKDGRSQLGLVALPAGPKIDLDFLAGESDMFLMDGSSLRKFAAQGSLAPLDAWADKLNAEARGRLQLKALSNENGEPHIYAVPVSGLDYLLQQGFPGDNYYLTIRAADPDKSKQVNKLNSAMAVLDKLAGAE